ncbi:MAG: hypothetical protein ABR562_09860, partial [Thermoplasmatota archaeon]
MDAGGGLALSLAAAPAWAGIVSNPSTDSGYVITRIVSQFRLPGAAQRLGKDGQERGPEHRSVEDGVAADDRVDEHVHR